MKKCISYLVALTLFVLTAGLRAQGTAFTYQGQLNTTNGPLTGSYDISFTLFNTSACGLASDEQRHACEQRVVHRHG
jgi:hypothetical protein